LARRATIVDQIVDAFGDEWDVREYRPTAHGFDLALGWPSDRPRGAGQAGGPRVILTENLVLYLTSMRHTPARIRLPIGRTAIKRLRRILGHDWQIDRAAWWEERTDDLSDMTIEEFAARHGVSVGAVVNARHAVLGRVLRPAGWWRAPDVAALLLSDRPRADIAADLDISIGSLGRLRWMLRRSPNGATRTSDTAPVDPEIAEAMRLVSAGHTYVEAARAVGRDKDLIRLACRAAGVISPRAARRAASRHITDEQRRAVIARVRKGATCTEAAAAAGVSYGQASYICAKAGIEIANRVHRNRGTHRAITPEIRAEVMALTREGLTGMAIAERLGMPDPTVYKIRATMGVVGRQGRSDLTPETKAQVRALGTDGVPLDEIAARLGITRQQVYGLLNRPRLHRRRPNHAPAVLEMLRSGKSARNIAATLGISRSTVYNIHNRARGGNKTRE